MELSADAVRVFDSVREGILIIDTEGRIVFANAAYLNFLSKERGRAFGRGDVLGRLLVELRPGAKLPTVLATGRAIMQEPRQETADIYFVNMYPVFDDGRVVAAVSVVTFMEEAATFTHALEDLERRNRQMLRRVSKAMTARDTFDSIVAVGQRSVECKEFAQRIAVSDVPVLLVSESGAGKEAYAHAIHNASPRSHGIFTSINCATLDRARLESELFGYADGAFAGARQGGKIGLMEAAEGGTLFLDEISEMDMATQFKLLRALQDHKIRPAGAMEEIPVNVRIVAASNVDLLEYVKENRFRLDLYYLLNTFCVHIPPLRERKEDIPALTSRILNEISTSLKRGITISRESMERLARHDWPGNVRELRNVLEFSAYLSPDGHITADLLPENIGAEAAEPLTLYERVRRFERSEIRRTLQHCGSDLAGKKDAARELGISLASLYAKLKEPEDQ